MFKKVLNRGDACGRTYEVYFSIRDRQQSITRCIGIEKTAVTRSMATPHHERTTEASVDV